LPDDEDHEAIDGRHRMTKEKPSNFAASVRQRLLNIIRETGDDANLVWTRYAVIEIGVCLLDVSGSDLAI